MSSKEDREVLQEVWAGKIPAMFSLSEQDCGNTIPDPCYLMLPRMSYLPLATEKVSEGHGEQVHHLPHLAGQETLLLPHIWGGRRDVVLMQWLPPEVAPSHRAAT